MSSPINPQCRWDVLPTPTQPYSRFDSIAKLNKALGTHPLNPITIAQLEMGRNISGLLHVQDYDIRLLTLGGEPLIAVSYQKDSVMTRLFAKPK